MEEHVHLLAHAHLYTEDFEHRLDSLDCERLFFAIITIDVRSVKVLFLFPCSFWTDFDLLLCYYFGSQSGRLRILVYALQHIPSTLDTPKTTTSRPSARLGRR